MSELLDFKMSSYMEIGGIVFVNIMESNFKPNFLSRFFFKISISDCISIQNHNDLPVSQLFRFVIEVQ